MLNLHEELRIAINPPHHMSRLDDHQNRHSAIGMYSTHDYDVCALRLSAQATPKHPRHRHLSDVSPVANPDKHTTSKLLLNVLWRI